MNNPYKPSRASLSATDVAKPQERTHVTEGATPDASDEATDFVRIATCGTPTEAHLLKGVLEASGLFATIADAGIAQANPWMTQTIGGVRLLVPAAQAEAARQAIAEYNSGAFQLDGEGAARERQFAELKVPVFSPDRATLLSFLLTPAFGAALQLANSRGIGNPRQTLTSWLWFCVLSLATAAAVAVMHKLNPGPLVVFRASIAISWVTMLWYFLAAHSQTKKLIDTYGRRYAQRNIAPISLGTAAAFGDVGWALSEYL